MASEAKDISAEPTENQIIQHNGASYSTIREGLAYILVPETSSTTPCQNPKAPGDDSQSVFYNPIQQFNRDLSVLAIKAHGKEVVKQRIKASSERHERLVEKKRKRQERHDQRESARPSKIGKLAESDSKETDTGVANPEVTPLVAPPEDVTRDALSKDSEGPNGKANADAAETAQAEGEPVAPVAPVDSSAQPDATAAPAPSTAPPTSEARKGPGIKILDALSATGLRALRYVHELPFPTTVTSNDLLDAAVESIKLNIKHNKLEDKIEVTKGNALSHMYTLISNELSKITVATAAGHQRQIKSEKYDVIDLDPYGTAATFFDAAVQAVRDDGGLLCVTCTDPSVWASNSYPEKAFALYGGIPLKGFHSHEAGLRLILHAIATSAARYGLAIKPLLSLSIDYYGRVFVRVTRSPASVKFQAGKTMMVYNCDVGCGAWETQLLLRNRPTPNKKGSGVFYKHGFAQGPSADRRCQHCDQKMHLAGPMYAGRMHSAEFIKSILDDLPSVSTDVYGTTDRIRGMLVTALEELMEPRSSLGGEGVDDGATENGNGYGHGLQKTKEENPLAALEPYPFFFSPSALSKVVHCETPDEDSIRGALRGLGYRVTRSHCKPGSIKTDAPWSAVWDVMRAWALRKGPVRESSFKPGTAGYHIMGFAAPPAAEAAADKEKGKKTQQQDGSSGNEEENRPPTTIIEGEGKENEKKQKQQQQKTRPEIVFDTKLGREKNKEKLVRYQVNPRENWGPMSKATGGS